MLRKRVVGACMTVGVVFPLIGVGVAADPAAMARFAVVMNGAAVKDNQTGLIWSRSRIGSTTCGADQWRGAPAKRSAGRRDGAPPRSMN